MEGVGKELKIRVRFLMTLTTAAQHGAVRTRDMSPVHRPNERDCMVALVMEGQFDEKKIFEALHEGRIRNFWVEVTTESLIVRGHHVRQAMNLKTCGVLDTITNRVVGLLVSSGFATDERHAMRMIVGRCIRLSGTVAPAKPKRTRKRKPRSKAQAKVLATA